MTHPFEVPLEAHPGSFLQCLFPVLKEEYPLSPSRGPSPFMEKILYTCLLNE